MGEESHSNDQKSRSLDNENTTLPFDVGFLKFIEPRIKEIEVLTEAIDEPQKNGLVFQRLPRHMRRRIMGHTSKRMPRSVREAHIKQLEKSGFPPKSKRQSRKYRRRPKTLLAEYNRRQRSFVWLETHIWHAKRFHMGEKWGYKLPLHPNDKSIRACYRASSNHCLLHDMSYLNCLEIKGSEAVLLNGLLQLCSNSCGLVFNAKSLIGGQREGKVMIYRHDQYPYGAIGNVSVLWKPPEPNKERTIWMWAHPSFSKEVVCELQEVFKLSFKEESETFVQNSSASKSQSSNTKKTAESKKLASRCPPKIYKNQELGVELTVLKDALARLSLTGPLSHAVLWEVLALVPQHPETQEGGVTKVKPMDIDDIFSSVVPREKQSAVCVDNPTTDITDGDWYQTLAAKSRNVDDTCKMQSVTWLGMAGSNSPAELPPHCVLGLTVLDPRLNFPLKRFKATPGKPSPEPISQLPPEVSDSPIWESWVREEVTSSKLSDAMVNALRTENLVPGISEQETMARGAKIPILLIQRPGSPSSSTKRLGFGCGWDMILPLGWVMPFWRGMVLRGARVGGLRELEAFGTEGFSPHEPLDAPDTQAGRCEEMTRRDSSMNEHFKKPPAKRTNFMKLGIVSPFSAPWSQLVSEWSNQESDWYIQRDISTLENLRKSLQIRTELQIKHDSSSLVMVGVVLEKGGSLDSWAIICLPTSKDDLICAPEEPAHTDELEFARREARNVHQAQLRTLRRKRVKHKKKGEEVKPDEAADKAMKHALDMRKLWLPDPRTVKDSCVRPVAGFVTQGKYSYLEGRAAGVGFVTEVSLRQMLSEQPWNCKGEILVRNTFSLHYRVARISIL